jgi:hypothetical protein
MSFTSTTNSGLKILRQFGGIPAFNSLMISDFAGAGEDSFRIGSVTALRALKLLPIMRMANFSQIGMKTRSMRPLIIASIAAR